MRALLILSAFLLELQFTISAPQQRLLKQGIPKQRELKWDEDHMHQMPLYTNRQPSGRNDWISPPDNRVQTDWHALSQQRIQEVLKKTQRTLELHHPAKNVIFFLGDGMGISTTSAARIYMAQRRNLTGDDAQLSWERMPNSAFAKTYSTDHQVSDSGATATALVCGEKTGNNLICVNQETVYNNCSSQKGNELKSILHHSMDEGKWTGVVSTARITHATPACVYAHSASRFWESDSDLEQEAMGTCTDTAYQLIHEHGNENIRVILGGGRAPFMPNDETDPEYPEEFGNREDGRNLIEEWLQKKRAAGLSDNEYKYVNNLQDFNNVDENDIQYLMGLFEPSHMRFESDRQNDVFGEPSLSEMVEKSIKVLQRSHNGFFLFVESGRIDYAHHANWVQKALVETVEMSDAVQKALDLTSEEDTLVVVTADHSHVLTMAGYLRSNIDVLTFDIPNLATDLKPYASLSYTNGPGFYNHRTDENGEETPRINLIGLKENMTDMEYTADAAIPLYAETHGGEDVAVYTRGPMAHLFHGTQEQSFIGNLMMYSACVGRNKDLCEQGVKNLCHTDASPANYNFINSRLVITLLVFNLFLLNKFW